MKISGLPGVKNMVWIFDPDEIEKVSLYNKRDRLITKINVCRIGVKGIIYLGFQK
jgi:hypothetical protein